MVWECMSYRGPGLLTTVEGNLKSEGYIQILGDYMMPSADLLGYGGRYIYQEDNAPCHKSRIVSHWKAVHYISILEWPPQSPDLSPIENLWGTMARMVRGRVIQNKADLDREVHAVWDEIPAIQFRRLVASMPRRVEAVIQARGGRMHCFVIFCIVHFMIMFMF